MTSAVAVKNPKNYELASIRVVLEPFEATLLPKLRSIAFTALA